MPKIKRELIRTWLEDHNWSVGRLAAECSVLSEDNISEGAMRNVVNGVDGMRMGRIKLICRVTAKYGDGIAYEELVVKDPSMADAKTASILGRVEVVFRPEGGEGSPSSGE